MIVRRNMGMGALSKSDLIKPALQSVIATNLANPRPAAPPPTPPMNGSWRASTGASAGFDGGPGAAAQVGAGSVVLTSSNPWASRPPVNPAAVLAPTLPTTTSSDVSTAFGDTGSLSWPVILGGGVLVVGLLALLMHRRAA